jgi:diadenosine tetraphosphate (Ap4A) HIT family hydrolase
MTPTGEGIDCFSCRNTAAADLPIRERILRTPHWRVAHAFDTAARGWLVVLPVRHVSALADLDAAAAVELGSLLVDVSAALRDVVGCAKTYVALFAEAEGFSHLHFHIVPRMPDQPLELTGPAVFRLLGVPAEQRVPDDEIDRLALALSRALAS